MDYVMKIEIGDRDQNNIITLSLETEAGIAKDSYEESIKAARRQVNIPGFRKGKAPKSMVIDYVGEDYLKSRALHQEFLLSLLNDAVKKEQLDIVTILSLDKVELESSEAPVVLEARIELYPEVQLGQYKDLEVEVDVVKFDLDKQLEESLERIQKSHSSFEDAAEDAVIAMGDQIDLDFDGKFNDGTDEEPNWVAKEGMKAEGHTVVVEPGRFIDGFLEQTVGMKIGTEAELDVRFPASYGVPELQDKAAKFAIKINKISKAVVPELDDELAKKNQNPKADTLDDLKAKLKENLEEANKKEREAATDFALFKALRTATEVEVPEKAIEMTLRNDLMQMSRMYGIPAEQMQAIMQNIAIDKEKDAVKERLANTMILNTIVKTEDFEVSENELNKAWEEYCKQTKIKADNEEAKANQIDEIKLNLQSDKAKEFLHSKNKISYNELTEEEIKAKQEAEAAKTEESEADEAKEDKAEAKA